MKRILFVCSMGMSSAIAMNSLAKEAQEKNIELEIFSTGAGQVEEELTRANYDLVMIAPQIKHRFQDIEPIVSANKIPCIMILPRSYGPLGGPFLLNQVKETIELN